MQRDPGIYLMAEENSKNPPLEDRLMKAVRPVICDPLPPNDVGRIAQSDREKENR